MEPASSCGSVMPSTYPLEQAHGLMRTQNDRHTKEGSEETDRGDINFMDFFWYSGPQGFILI